MTCKDKASYGVFATLCLLKGSKVGLKLKANGSLCTQHFSLFSLKRGKWDVLLKRGNVGVKLKAPRSLFIKHFSLFSLKRGKLDIWA